MAGAPNPILSLQYGRALAALSVAAFHLSIMMGVDRYGGSPVFQAYTHRGNLGVDFFFVLSGFIIMLAHQVDINNPKQFTSYLWKRFCRVYPIYWIYTIIFTGLILVGFGQRSGLPNNVEGWLTTFTLVRFSSDSPPLAPAWTLFHEVAFYLAFSLLIINRRLGTVAMAAWGLWAISLFAYPGESNRTAFNVYSSAHILHFVLGAFSYWATQRFSAAGNRILSSTAILVASVGATEVFTRGHPLHNLCWALVFASFISVLTQLEQRATSNEQRATRIIPKVNALALLGDSSYSLYLLHLPMQGLLLKILMKTPFGHTAGGREIGFLVIMLATCLIAFAAYKYIEKPLLSKLRGMGPKKPLDTALGIEDCALAAKAQ